ncbi:MAG: TetR/AcrR family transcriptional regulator [Myxococcales bacterium]|nr:TetR/AcrR family transcriptional regulator [Myxococcales bacterium]
MGQAGLELFLEKGVAAVTIDDIVAGANVAKGSFYRYFESKEQMVEWLFDPLARGMRNAFDRCEESLHDAKNAADLSKAYQGLATDMIQLLAQFRDLAKLYLQESRSPAIGARKTIRDLGDLVADRAVQLTHVAIQHGLLRDFGAPISALAVIGATERLLFGYLVEERFENPLEIPRALITLVLEGMRPNG